MTSLDPQSADPEAQRTIFRAVFANASILLSGKTVNAVLSLGYTALAARTLGLHEFGLLVLIYAYAQTISDVAGFQSWQAVLHYGMDPLDQKKPGLLQRVLRFTLLLDGASAIIGVIVAIALANLVGPRLGWPADAGPLVTLYLTSIIFMAYATPSGVLRLFNRFDLLAIQSGVASLVRLIGAAALFSTGGELGDFLLVWYLGDVAAFFYLYCTAARELAKRGLLKNFAWHGHGLTEDLPGIWRFCWTTNFNMTLSLAFTRIGTLAVGWFLGPAEAALYRVAQQVGNAIAKPAKLATPALYPELARLWASGSHHDLYGVALRVALAAGATAFILLGVAALTGEIILSTVIGPEFAAAAPIMLWLVAAAAISILALPLEPLLISTGRPSVALATRAGVTLVYLPILMLALRDIGLLGAGYAAVAATVLLTLVQLGAVLYLRRLAVNS